MDYPKILVGAPVAGHYEYCLSQYLAALQNFDYPNYDILLVDNSETDIFYQKLKLLGIPVVRLGHEEEAIKMRMVQGRNYLRKKVLDEGYDYFFNLDQDVIPPRDTLKRLVTHQKKVLTGIYYNYFKIENEWKKTPIIYRLLTPTEQQTLLTQGKENLAQTNLDLYRRLEGNQWDFTKTYVEYTTSDVATPKLLEIEACGTGCILIHRDILTQLNFKFNEGAGFDDVIFCSEVRPLLHEKIYADTAIQCEHLVRERPWSWANVGNDQFIIYGANKFKRK